MRGRWLPQMAAILPTMACMARRGWGENSIYFQHDGDCTDPATTSSTVPWITCLPSMSGGQPYRPSHQLNDQIGAGDLKGHRGGEAGAPVGRSGPPEWAGVCEMRLDPSQPW